MSAQTDKGPTYDSGVCRCCGSIKRCRVLNEKYQFMGQPEIYSDMFMDCFGLLLSHLDGDPSERLICATCVGQLRGADSFRKQALLWEEKLLQSKLQVDDLKVEVKLEICKDEENKGDDEDLLDDHQGSPSYDSDVDYELPRKKKRKKLSKLDKKVMPIRKVKRKARKKDKVDAELMMESLDTMKRKLESMGWDQELNNTNIDLEESKKKNVDNEHKIFANVTAFVQNSYACPFDASFSDYYCIYCRHIFTDPNKLKQHTLTHDPTSFPEVYSKKICQIDISRIDCRLCTQSITDVNSFKNHASSRHGVFFYSDVNNEFLKYNLTATSLTCTECGSSFSFFHALKKHMAEHFGTCICDVCGAHYFEERMLLIHQKTHQKQDQNYPCKDCGKSFKSKHSRFLHEAKMHKKEPTYQCSKCDEVFFSYSIRYRHLIDVHGEQRNFQCEHCIKTYDSRKSLREHTRRYHLKIFKHQCTLCDKRFYLPSRLKEHMVTHTGERNFRCQYCGKSYPRMRGLKVHMQSHSSEKKFRCTMCNASFTQNVNLKNHVKRQHQSMDGDEEFPEYSDVDYELPRKKKRKKLSKLDKKVMPIRKVKRKARKKDKVDAELMMESLDTMKRKLESMGWDQELNNTNIDLEESKKKNVDNEHKIFANVTAFVQNSYACPFDASFSDYYCIYCRHIFTDPNKLKQHTLTHDPTSFPEVYTKKICQIDITRIDCRLCTQSITDVNSFKNHASSRHGVFFYSDVNNEFLKYNLTATSLTCTECGSSFSFFHALKKHMAEHFGTCICDVCGAHYFEERMLLIHQKTHQKQDQNYPCKDCGKSFKSKHSRFLHEAKMHKKEPTYQCSKCDEVFFSYSIRYRHLIDVHGEQRNFQCEHCIKTYDSRKSLREHTRRYHLKIFKHQCTLCDKRFYLPSRLKEHMVTHTGERNFRCQYCGKSYPRMRGLKVHMQSHSSEKKFRCTMCNASFTQNVNLKNHVKRQHQSMDGDEEFPE